MSVEVWDLTVAIAHLGLKGVNKEHWDQYLQLEKMKYVRIDGVTPPEPGIIYSDNVQLTELGWEYFKKINPDTDEQGSNKS